MNVTGSNDERTQNESDTQRNETPISQRGSGQSVLFTPPSTAVQAAAAQVADQTRGSSQQQQVAGKGTGGTYGNIGNAGDGNTNSAFESAISATMWLD